MILNSGEASMKKDSSWIKYIRIFVLVSFAIYIIAFGYLTIGKTGNNQIDGANLVPFRTIMSYVRLIDIIPFIAISNLIGNILLTLPLALYLPILFTNLRKCWKTSLVGLAIILFVEVIQFLFGRGSFDIDDIILNMVGIFIGYVIWKLKPIQWVVRIYQG